MDVPEYSKDYRRAHVRHVTLSLDRKETRQVISSLVSKGGFKYVVGAGYVGGM